METQHVHSAHEHDHAHAGHHHHHHVVPESINGVFIFCVVLNLLFVIIEAVVGFAYDSVGLLSDAGHNLSDVFSLLLALFALQMVKIQATPHFTYGYKKGTILISLLNAVILLVAVGAIIVESIYRLKTHDAHVSGEAISWTAGIGILINGFTAWLLMRDRKKDLNIQGAFLHMLMDTLVSVGVVISGIVIMYTGAVWIDPVISLVIAGIILVSTFNLLRESLSLSMDAAPASVDVEKIHEGLHAFPGVEECHHLHIWAISTNETAATMHVVIKDLAQMEDTKNALKAFFAENGVSHCTFEFETDAAACQEKNGPLSLQNEEVEHKAK